MTTRCRDENEGHAARKRLFVLAGHRIGRFSFVFGTGGWSRDDEGAEPGGSTPSDGFDTVASRPTQPTDTSTHSARLTHRAGPQRGPNPQSGSTARAQPTVGFTVG